MLEWVVKYWVQWVFGQIVGAMSMGYRNLSKKVKGDKAQREAIVAGVQALLRNEIMMEYERCVEKGHASISDRENMDAMHKAYKDLNGNGVVTDIVNRFVKLPIREEEM